MTQPVVIQPQFQYRWSDTEFWHIPQGAFAWREMPPVMLRDTLAYLTSNAKALYVYTNCAQPSDTAAYCWLAEQPTVRAGFNQAVQRRVPMPGRVARFCGTYLPRAGRIVTEELDEQSPALALNSDDLESLFDGTRDQRVARLAEPDVVRLIADRDPGAREQAQRAFDQHLEIQRQIQREVYAAARDQARGRRPFERIPLPEISPSVLPPRAAIAPPAQPPTRRRASTLRPPTPEPTPAARSPRLAARFLGKRKLE